MDTRYRIRKLKRFGDVFNSYYGRSMKQRAINAVWEVRLCNFVDKFGIERLTFCETTTLQKAVEPSKPPVARSTGDRHQDSKDSAPLETQGGRHWKHWHPFPSVMLVV
jgi:hypothetical protein